MVWNEALSQRLPCKCEIITGFKFWLKVNLLFIDEKAFAEQHKKAKSWQLNWTVLTKLNFWLKARLVGGVKCLKRCTNRAESSCVCTRVTTYPLYFSISIFFCRHYKRVVWKCLSLNPIRIGSASQSWNAERQPKSDVLSESVRFAALYLFLITERHKIQYLESFLFPSSWRLVPFLLIVMLKETAE